jgi:hypothetical protein
MNKPEFSKEQVDNLNKYQQSKTVHPYTCGSPKNIPECKRQSAWQRRLNGEQVEFSDENEGVLIATEKGWMCPCGKYTQDWY